MTDHVVLGQLAGHDAAALMRDGRLEDLLIDPPEDLPRPGAIFRAGVDRAMKGQGGLFLRLPGCKGYLRHSKGVPTGKPLLVQVSGFAEPGKAIPVSSRPLFKSRYCIVSPGAPGANISRAIRDEEELVRLRSLASEIDLPEGFGLILRSAAEGTDEDEIEADILAMMDTATAVMADAGKDPELLLDGPGVAERAWAEWPTASPPDPDEDFASGGVLDALDALIGPESLPGGGSIYVEATRALVAVDVNTGPDTSPAAGLKANLAAAKELPRALRLRGLGGQIVVDLAPVAKKDRMRVEQAFKSAFKRDTVETSLVGWTPLGNLEIQRKRERLPVAPLLSRHV